LKRQAAIGRGAGDHSSSSLHEVAARHHERLFGRHAMSTHRAGQQNLITSAHINDLQDVSTVDGQLTRPVAVRRERRDPERLT
jgi:hypothetical protein